MNPHTHTHMPGKREKVITREDILHGTLLYTMYRKDISIKGKKSHLWCLGGGLGTGQTAERQKGLWENENA